MASKDSSRFHKKYLHKDAVSFSKNLDDSEVRRNLGHREVDHGALALEPVQAHLLERVLEDAQVLLLLRRAC